MKKVLRGIGETVILNLIVLFIFSIIQKDAYLYLNPHPMIFIGIIIILRYGIVLGISSSVISSAVYILILYLTNGELRYGIYDIFFDYKNVYISLLTTVFIGIYIYKFRKQLLEQEKVFEELLKEYKLIEKTQINTGYEPPQKEVEDYNVNKEYNIDNTYEEDKNIENEYAYADLYNEESEGNKYNFGSIDLYEEEKTVGNEYNLGDLNLYEEQEIENKHIYDSINFYDEKAKGYNLNNSNVNKEKQEEDYNFKNINSFEGGTVKTEEFNYHDTDIFMDEEGNEQSYTSTNTFVEETIEDNYDYNNSHIQKEELLSNPTEMLNMNYLKHRVDEKKRRKENYNLFVYKLSNVDINTVYKIVNPMVNTDDTLAFNNKSGLFYILFGKNDNNHISSVEEGIKFIFDKKMVRV